MSQIPEVGSVVEREGDVSVSVCTRSEVGSQTVKSSFSGEAGPICSEAPRTPSVCGSVCGGGAASVPCGPGGPSGREGRRDSWLAGGREVLSSER